MRSYHGNDGLTPDGGKIGIGLFMIDLNPASRVSSKSLRCATPPQNAAHRRFPGGRSGRLSSFIRQTARKGRETAPERTWEKMAPGSSPEPARPVKKRCNYFINSQSK
jgi:hypothetical protein